jgi:CBS domain-containing protein
MFKRHIQDILVPLSAYPNILDTATLRDAFAALKNGEMGDKHYRHILVLNDLKQLVGMLGLHDIIHGLFPDYLSTGKLGHFDGTQPDFPALTLIWQETCSTQFKEAANKPVREFMAPVPNTVKPDDPITLAAYLMVKHGSDVLPVVDKQQVIGVVRIPDVFEIASRAVLHD